MFYLTWIIFSISNLKPNMSPWARFLGGYHRRGSEIVYDLEVTKKICTFERVDKAIFWRSKMIEKKTSQVSIACNMSGIIKFICVLWLQFLQTGSRS